MRSRYLLLSALIPAVAAVLWLSSPGPHPQAAAANLDRRACANSEDKWRWQRPAEAEIKRRLTPQQYEVTQEEGTEPPFSNAYWDNKDDGIYVDIVSGEPLFSSKEKFKSGTGWPSFHSPLEPDLVVEHEDRKLWMTRVEVRSRHGDSHLGHVFDDGPEPTGLRYCVNSASMRFIPAADLEKEGYGDYAALFEKKEHNAKHKPDKAIATFGMGCFWGAEADFCALKGVTATRVGYAGGQSKNPGYQQVSSGRTGHAEVVEVEYDPSLVSYEELLHVFWNRHDPTTPGRQGPDVGTQYRSMILFHDDNQKRIAEESKRATEGRYLNPVVTEIVPAKVFYVAEEYHQGYLEKRGRVRCNR